MEKMTPPLWDELETVTPFNRRENWGEEISVTLVCGVVTLRRLAGNPVHINNGYATDGHSPDSMHYKGLAVDGYISGLSLYEQARLCLKVGFGGIGVYPHWHTPGFHVDYRQLAGKPSVYWIRDGWGRYIYFTDPDDWLRAVKEG